MDRSYNAIAFNFADIIKIAIMLTKATFNKSKKTR